MSCYVAYDVRHVMDSVRYLILITMYNYQYWLLDVTITINYNYQHYCTININYLYNRRPSEEQRPGHERVHHDEVLPHPLLRGVTYIYIYIYV